MAQVVRGGEYIETEQDTALYNVFTRTWWKRNSAWPNGIEPGAGSKHYLERGLTYSEAVRCCKAWNDTHNPGKLSRKAEFERCSK